MGVVPVLLTRTQILRGAMLGFLRLANRLAALSPGRGLKGCFQIAVVRLLWTIGHGVVVVMASDYAIRS